MAFVKYSEGKITDVIEKGKKPPKQTKESKEALEKYNELKRDEKKDEKPN